MDGRKHHLYYVLKVWGVALSIFAPILMFNNIPYWYFLLILGVVVYFLPNLTSHYYKNLDPPPANWYK